MEEREIVVGQLSWCSLGLSPVYPPALEQQSMLPYRSMASLVLVCCLIDQIKSCSKEFLFLMLQNTSIAGFAFALQVTLQLPQVIVAAEALSLFSPSKNLEIMCFKLSHLLV